MSHRRAYGPHRVMSDAIKARNVAESILEHQLPLTEATWQRYGLEGKPEQQRLVHEWIYLSTTKP